MNYASIAAAAAALALAGCQQKETGPEEGTTATAPPVAPPVTPATADPSAARPISSFAGMDANGDGKVVSAEYATAAQTMFRMMDGDTDGVVTVAEMDSAREAIGGTTAVSSEKKIAYIDGDGDGQLTLAEHVAGTNAVFAQMDTNHDGALDRTEWDIGHKPLRDLEAAAQGG